MSLWEYIRLYQFIPARFIENYSLGIDKINKILASQIVLKTNVASWSEAQTKATGVYTRMIVVAVDEHDNNRVNNIYFYLGDNQPLTNPLF